MAKKIVFIVLILVFILLGAAGVFFYQGLQAPDQSVNPMEKEFVVEKGESLFSVIHRLEEEGLVRNGNILKVYVKFFYPAAIKNGVYKFNDGMSPREILELLEQGRQELEKVTVPEGLASRQIAGILAEAGVVESAEQFLSLVNSSDFAVSLGVESGSLEGYLYPDTYYFQKDFPVEKIIAYMVGTFFRTLKSIYPYYDDFTVEKMQEKIILASIIEKEYRVENEAPTIASVFYNRLRIGMPLQSCATVIYVITEELGKDHPERIFESDLKIPSPFNTYYNQALPPRPIANPGYVALNAAFNPAQTEYLFFVVKDAAKGTHTFTTTLSDHNRARQLYLAGFRSK